MNINTIKKYQIKYFAVIKKYHITYFAVIKQFSNEMFGRACRYPGMAAIDFHLSIKARSCQI